MRKDLEIFTAFPVVTTRRHHRGKVSINNGMKSCWVDTLHKVLYTFTGLLPEVLFENKMQCREFLVNNMNGYKV